MAGPCPDDATLAGSLAKVWNVNPTQKVEIVACHPGRFGVDAWLVYAYVDTYDADEPSREPADSVVRRIILTDDAVVADSEPAFISPYMRYEGTARAGTPVDLDGDGVDEVLETEWSISQGDFSEWLDVLRVDQASHTFVTDFHLVTDYDNDGNPCGDELECRASHQVTTVAGGARRIVVTSEAGCENAGVRTYGYRDGAFGLIPRAD